MIIIDLVVILSLKFYKLPGRKKKKQRLCSSTPGLCIHEGLLCQWFICYGHRWSDGAKEACLWALSFDSADGNCGALRHEQGLQYSLYDTNMPRRGVLLLNNLAIWTGSHAGIDELLYMLGAFYGCVAAFSSGLNRSWMAV